MAGENEEFPVYKSKDVPFSWKSTKEICADAVFYNDKSTKFQQGELGDCWLAAAIESLRQENTQESFQKVVLASENELEFRFWQDGKHEQSIKLENDEVPTNNDDLVFVRNAEGNEYWGILLEKAYAKWIGSYEGLEGGFWTDAIQSFTGGVVERIKLNDKKPENLFEIMLNCYNNGSFQCCITKEEHNVQLPEKYHSCCINVVKIEAGDAKKIWVQDPNTKECNVLIYEDFVNQYHRLDMCHKNLDNLSALNGRNIGDGPWESQIFPVQLDNDKGLSDEYSITLTDLDDDETGCTFVMELIQKIKSEIITQNHIKPWDAVVDLELEVGNESFIIKFPQETRCFTLQPGSYDIKITTEIEDHAEICMRIFSKKQYSMNPKE